MLYEFRPQEASRKRIFSIVSVSFARIYSSPQLNALTLVQVFLAFLRLGCFKRPFEGRSPCPQIAECVFLRSILNQRGATSFDASDDCFVNAWAVFPLHGVVVVRLGPWPHHEIMPDSSLVSRQACQPLPAIQTIQNPAVQQFILADAVPSSCLS